MLPPVTGLVADSIPGSAGLHATFFVPMVAYVLIGAFAVTAGRARVVAVRGAVGGAGAAH